MTSRTAVYGPVRTVVWEGRNREVPPYPDPWPDSDLPTRLLRGRYQGVSGHGLARAGITRPDSHPSAFQPRQALESERHERPIFPEPLCAPA